MKSVMMPDRVGTSKGRIAANEDCLTRMLAMALCPWAIRSVLPEGNSNSSETPRTAWLKHST